MDCAELISQKSLNETTAALQSEGQPRCSSAGARSLAALQGADSTVIFQYKNVNKKI